MLCIFHGIVMGFMEKIYVHLPTKRKRNNSGRKELSKKGLLYGMCCNHVLNTYRKVFVKMYNIASYSGEVIFRWIRATCIDCETKEEYDQYFASLVKFMEKEATRETVGKNVYKQPYHSFNCYSQRRTNSLVI